MTVRIIRAARVLTGVGTAFSPGAVIIDNQHIAWSGPADRLPDEWMTEPHEYVRLAEATVLPGLVDAHVHLAFDQAPHPRRTAIATVRAATGQLLRAGITTARDLGAPCGINTATTASGNGPRILSAGVPLTVPGGHCEEFGGSVTSVSDIDRIVSHNVERGATWIKVMVTGGFTSHGGSSPCAPQFTDAQLADIVTAAHDRGLPVAAHAHGTAGIRQSVDVGVSTIEHCTWMTDCGFHLDHGILRDIADRRIPVCPTINHLARHATGKLRWAVRRDHLRTMLDAGVQLIPGSDAGIPHTPHHMFAHSLSAYIDLGLSPAEVIDLATHRAAEALRIAHLTGTLTAGQSADLIAVPGDPTRELHVLTTPIFAMTAGQLHHLDTHTEEDSQR